MKNIRYDGKDMSVTRLYSHDWFCFLWHQHIPNFSICYGSSRNLRIHSVRYLLHPNHSLDVLSRMVTLSPVCCPSHFSQSFRIHPVWVSILLQEFVFVYWVNFLLRCSDYHSIRVLCLTSILPFSPCRTWLFLVLPSWISRSS